MGNYHGVEDQHFLQARLISNDFTFVGIVVFHRMSIMCNINQAAIHHLLKELVHSKESPQLCYSHCISIQSCWGIVKKKFGLKDELDKVLKFASWCEGYNENTANYWMGLEIVIWFWIERQKGYLINV
jgi:hypothetical protein